MGIEQCAFTISYVRTVDKITDYIVLERKKINI